MFKRPLFKYLLWIFAGFVLFMGLALASLQTKPVQGYVAQLTSRLLSGKDIKIELQGLEGFLPWNIELKTLRVHGPQGTFLLVQDAELRWSFQEILLGRIQIPLLQADKIHLHRPLPAEQKPTQKTDISLPAILPLNIHELSCSEIIAEKEFLGQKSVFSLQGSISYRYEKQTGAEILLSRIDQPGHYRIRANYQKNKDYLNLDISLREGSEGFLSNRLPPAINEPIQVTLQGSGPLSHWSGNLLFSLDKKDFISADLLYNKKDNLHGLEMKGSLLSYARLVPEQLGDILGQETGFFLQLKINPVKNLLELTQGNLSLALGTLQGEAKFDWKVRHVQGHVQARIPDSYKLQPVLPLQIQGTTGLKASVSGPLSSLHLNAELQTEVLEVDSFKVQGCRITLQTDLSPEDPDSGYLLQGQAGASMIKQKSRPLLSGPVSADFKIFVPPSAGQVLIKNAQLKVDQKNQNGKSRQNPPLFPSEADLKATGIIDLDHKFFDITWDASIPKIAGLLPLPPKDLKGQLSATGHLKGNFDQFEGSTQVDLSRVSFRSLPINTIQLDIEHFNLPGRPQGKININLLSRDVKISGGGDFILQKENLNISSFWLQAPDSKVWGRAILSLQGRVQEAQLHLEAQDLAWAEKLIQFPVQGQIDMDIQGKQRTPETRIDFRLQAKNFVFPGYEANEISASGRLQNLKELNGNIKCRIEGFNSKQVHLDELKLSAAGDKDQAHLDLTVKGRKAKSFSLQTQAEIRRKDKGFKLSSDKGQGDYGEVPFSWNQTLSLEFAPQESILNADKIRVAGGLAGIKATIIKDRIQALLKLDHLELKPLLPKKYSNFQGLCNLDLEVTGTFNDPSIDFQMKIQKFGPSGKDISGLIPAFFMLEGSYRQKAFKINISSSGLDKFNVQGNLALPSSLSLYPFALKIHSGLQGAAEVVIDLSLLQSLPAMDGQDLQGNFTSRIDISGSLRQPLLKGDLSLQNGSYENLQSGTVLRDIQMTASLKGQEIILNEFTATDGGSGQIQAKGRIVPFPQSDFFLDLQFILDKARLVRLDPFKANISGNMQMKGDRSNIKITGGLSLFPTHIRIPEKGPQGMGDLKIVEINGEKTQESSSSDGKPSSLWTGLLIDVRVDIPSALYVRGRGLDSEWQGNLDVKGNAQKPRINGRMDLVRGKFDFLGKVFKLQKGHIIFTGKEEFDPLLDITAEYNAKEFTALLHVSGSIYQPEISLESNPAYPQDEILSRILFNRSLSQITPLQAVKLAYALNTLARGGGPGLMGKFKDLLHIDQFEVQQMSEEEGTVIGVGKYLHEAVYFKVEQGLGAEQSIVSVEIEITPNISIESEVGTVAEGLEIKWQFTY